MDCDDIEELSDDDSNPATPTSTAAIDWELFKKHSPPVLSGKRTPKPVRHSLPASLNMDVESANAPERCNGPANGRRPESPAQPMDGDFAGDAQPDNRSGSRQQSHWDIEELTDDDSNPPEPTFSSVFGSPSRSVSRRTPKPVRKTPPKMDVDSDSSTERGGGPSRVASRPKTPTELPDRSERTVRTCADDSAALPSNSVDKPAPKSYNPFRTEQTEPSAPSDRSRLLSALKHRAWTSPVANAAAAADARCSRTAHINQTQLPVLVDYSSSSSSSPPPLPQRKTPVRSRRARKAAPKPIVKLTYADLTRDEDPDDDFDHLRSWSSLAPVRRSRKPADSPVSYADLTQGSVENAAATDVIELDDDDDDIVVCSGIVEPDAVRNLLVYPGRGMAGSLTITSEDFVRLAPGTYLNDKIIDFYMMYVRNEMLGPTDQQKIHMFSTFFYNRLTMRPAHGRRPTSAERHALVKTWTKNVNLFDKDFVFVPVNESEHWYLAVICFPDLTGPVAKYGRAPVSSQETKVPILQPCILIFESMLEDKHRDTVANLHKYLQCEYGVQYPGEQRVFSQATMPGVKLDCPQQDNLYDCGLFVLHNAEDFILNPIVNYKFPIKHCNTGNLAVLGKRQQIANIITELVKKNEPANLPFVPELDFQQSDSDSD